MKKLIIYMMVSLAIACMAKGVVMAQESIDKEIVVVRPYQPSLSDANKINMSPRVSDSISIHPSFDYTIEPRPYETDFQVRPITPANLVAPPLAKLYKTYLKLGVGNYLIPLGELHINSLRSRENQWGLALKHYSINGKIKLDNGEKVSPGFFENSGSLYGRKVFRNSYLSGKVKAAYEGGNFYGYNTTVDTSLAKEDIQQNYLLLDAAFQMGSIYKDSIHLNYTGSLDYQYTLDNYQNWEHGVILSANLNQKFRSGSTYGLDLTGHYYYTSESTDSVNNTIVELAPWMSKTTSEYAYRIGVNLTADVRGDDFKPYFYPVARLQINLVKGILVPYFGVDGGIQVNNLRSVINENRFITPGLSVTNTNRKIRGYVGMNGNYTPRLSYDLGFSYAIMNNMAFFINDTNTALGNTFDVVYDDAEVLELFAELQYHESERLNLVLEGSYRQYKMETLSHPWHMPSVNISLTAQYNLKDKILVDGGLNYVGERFAQGSPTDPEPVSLKGFTDVNLGVEYRYTKILSAFIRFNNILSSPNHLFYQYPRIGFNMMAGFTYAL